MADPNRQTKFLLQSVVAVASLLLLLLRISSPPHPKTTSAVDTHPRRQLHVANQHCYNTLYPDLCVSTLADIPNLRSKSLPEVISAVIHRVEGEVLFTSQNCTGLLRKKFRKLDARQRLAITDCLQLFNSTVDFLRGAASDLDYSANSSTAATRFSDLQTLLSAAMTNQYTCLDGFSYEPNDTVRSSIEGRIHHISRLVSNSLAMSTRLPRRRPRREAFEGYGRVSGGFPSWLSRRDRRLLQAPLNATRVDLVVAKDGSGNFTTIGDAVAAAPNGSATRFVIYIKAGGYFENVEVPSSKRNLMFVGDGMWRTTVKASRNVVDGWTTFSSATVAVVGAGFLARDMTFENSAGPSKHQAVALRSGSDLSAFYRCSFVGYQDTLYVHSLRQFYRDCDVYGTVDFIFGNAAVVLQNCNLYARRPDPNQKNLFTAQGRDDPNQNTGISIHNCKVAAAADLQPVQSQFKNYLGRPWKMYSRTVFMQSQIDDLIDPAGWLEWDGNFALSTLYYGEYKNRGPGSNTTRRVTWAGYRVITNATEAGQFTVGNFIQGNQWLPGTSVPFTSGLI